MKYYRILNVFYCNFNPDLFSPLSWERGYFNTAKYESQLNTELIGFGGTPARTHAHTQLLSQPQMWRLDCFRLLTAVWEPPVFVTNTSLFKVNDNTLRAMSVRMFACLQNLSRNPVEILRSNFKIRGFWT